MAGTESAVNEDEYAGHILMRNVDYTFCTTDNNCVSIGINYGKNVSYSKTGGESLRAESSGLVGAADDGIVETRAAGDGGDGDASKEYARIAGGGSAGGLAFPRLCHIPPTGPAPGGVRAKATVYSTANPTVISRARMILSERDTSQKQFTALKSRAPFFSVLKFETGAVIVVGLQDPNLTNLCVTKAATDIADTLVHPISISNVSIVNTVSTFNRYHLNFMRIGKFFERHFIAYIYNPETFPGMFFKLRVPSKPLLPGETIGEYYTKVAAMRDSQGPDFNMKDWMRVKTVLTFKVGKNTVLGECGPDDVSIISKLLFGLFHYFMDHNIKVSKREAKRLRRRYGIPPLAWYLYVDMMFHSHPYVKPTADYVKNVIVGRPLRQSLDRTYYGDGDGIDAALSANLVPSSEETARVLDQMNAQMLCAAWPRSATSARECVYKVGRPGRPLFPRRIFSPDTLRSGPFDLVYSTSPSESLAGAMNGRVASAPGSWWLDRQEYKASMSSIVQKCTEEIAEMCAARGLIASASRTAAGHRSMERLCRTREVLARRGISAVSTASAFDEAVPSVVVGLGGGRGGNWSGGVSAHRADVSGDDNVSLARIDTHMAWYRFLNKHLLSGIAPDLAKLFGTDVYSLLHLVKNVPKTLGHALVLKDSGAADLLKDSTGAYKTPGDIYFSAILEEKSAAEQANARDGEEKRRVPRLKRNMETGEKSLFACSGCGQALIKGSPSVLRGACQSCEDSSTKFIESALSVISRDKKIKKRNKTGGQTRAPGARGRATSESGTCTSSTGILGCPSAVAGANRYCGTSAASVAPPPLPAADSASPSFSSASSPFFGPPVSDQAEASTVEETEFETDHSACRNGYFTPSDFIDSVHKYTDETTGTIKVGLGFKVEKVLSKMASGRGTEDRPTANYRTSLHSDTQNKTNLRKLLVAAIKEIGATEDVAKIFGKILERENGLDTLRQLVERRERE